MRVAQGGAQRVPSAPCEAGPQAEARGLWGYCKPMTYGPDMYTTFWSRNQHGYVLIIVMGLLAALSVMAFSLGAATRADLEQTQRFQDETVAELLSKAGIEWAIHYLNTVERQETLWQAPW